MCDIFFNHPCLFPFIFTNAYFHPPYWIPFMYWFWSRRYNSSLLSTSSTLSNFYNIYMNLFHPCSQLHIEYDSHPCQISSNGQNASIWSNSSMKPKMHQYNPINHQVFFFQWLVWSIWRTTMVNFIHEHLKKILARYNSSGKIYHTFMQHLRFICIVICHSHVCPMHLCGDLHPFDTSYVSSFTPLVHLPSLDN